MPTFEELQAQGAEPVAEGGGLSFEQLSAMGATGISPSVPKSPSPDMSSPWAGSDLSSDSAMKRLGNPIGDNLFTQTEKVPLSDFEQTLAEWGHTDLATAIGTFRQTAATLADPKQLAVMAAVEPILGVKYAGSVLKAGLMAAGALQAGSGGAELASGATKTPLEKAEAAKNVILGLSNMLPGAMAVYEGMLKRPGPAKVLSAAISPGSDHPAHILDAQVEQAIPYIKQAEADHLAQGSPQSVPDFMDPTGTNRIQLGGTDKIGLPDPKTMTSGSDRSVVMKRVQAFASLAKQKVWSDYVSMAPDTVVPNFFRRIMTAAKNSVQSTALGTGFKTDRAVLDAVNGVIGAAPGYPLKTFFSQPKAPRTFEDLIDIRTELNARANAFLQKTGIDKATAENAKPALAAVNAVNQEIGNILEEAGLPREMMDKYGALKDTEVAAGNAAELYTRATRAQQDRLPYRQMSSLSLAGAGMMRRMRGEGGTSTVEYGLMKGALEYLSNRASDASLQTNRAWREYSKNAVDQYGNPMGSPMLRKSDLLRKLREGSAQVAGPAAGITITQGNPFVTLTPVKNKAVQTGGRVADWFSGSQ